MHIMLNYYFDTEGMNNIDFNYYIHDIRLGDDSAVNAEIKNTIHANSDAIVSFECTNCLEKYQLTQIKSSILGYFFVIT